MSDIPNLTECLNRVASQIPIFENVEIGGIITSVLVNFNDLYDYVKNLGHGASGVVKCYQEKSTLNLFAMKEINIFDWKDIDKLQSEVDILRRISNNIQSSSIVKYHDCFIRKDETGPLFVIVTEYINGVSLENHLATTIKNGEYMNMKIIVRIAYWLFDTLALLHSKGYVHRDIKPGNIMVDNDNNRFVLIDFGLTCLISNKIAGGNQHILCTNGEFDGTVVFMAPEVWSPIHDTHKSFYHRSFLKSNKLDRMVLFDIWAAGITIYFLTENNIPWTEKFNTGIIKQITGSYEIPYIRSKEIKDVFDLILQKNPQERLRADYIRNYIGHVISNRYS